MEIGTGTATGEIEFHSRFLSRLRRAELGTGGEAAIRPYAELLVTSEIGSSNEGATGKELSHLRCAISVVVAEVGAIGHSAFLFFP